MSWLDKAIEAVAPAWGLNRARARAATAMLQRHYEAAAVSRRTQGWRRPIGDANAVMGGALGRARASARDMVRNNAHAKAGVETIADHIVGWGIQPSTMNKAALKVWDSWAGTIACDADGRNDLYGLQKLAARTVVEAGEVLIRRRLRRPEDNLPLPLQIQVLEPDYLDTERNEDLRGAGGQTTGRVINGVEFDLIGRRVAYWMFVEHPGASVFGGGYNSRRVPAEGVEHIYHMERPGQVRGMTWLAPIILTLKDYDEYVDAQLLTQKTTSYLGVVVTDIDGTAARFGTPEDQSATAPYIDSLRPGGVHYIPNGGNVQVVAPRPLGGFGEYATITLRQIAAGMGLSYEDLTGDFSDVNFSSARMSRLRHWARVEDWRYQMMVPLFCNTTWRWAMEVAAIMGKVAEIPEVEWTAPPPPMIEPDKEGLAYQRLVRSGLMSHSEVLRERGYKPSTVLDELEKDFDELDRRGLVLDIDPRKMTQAGQAQSTGATMTPPDSMEEDT